MFTVEQIDEISRKLNASARRDCDLPAAHTLTGGEFVPLVQDAENRNASLMQVATVIYDTVVREFREDLYKVNLGGYGVLEWHIGRAVSLFCAAAGRVASLVADLSGAADTLGAAYDSLGESVSKLSDGVDALFDATCRFAIKASPSFATVMIDGEERSSKAVRKGSEVAWEVTLAGYASQGGTLTVDSATTLDVELVRESWYTKEETDEMLGKISDLIVQVGKAVVENSGRIEAVEKSVASLGERVGANSEAIAGLEDGVSTLAKCCSVVLDALNSLTERVGELEGRPVYHTLTVIPDPDDATVTINGIAAASLTLAAGSVAEWTVSKEGYVTQTGALVLDEDTELPVTLERAEVVWSDIEITEFSYGDIPAEGGTATPTLRYRQTWGYGTETGGGEIEDGAEVSYEGVDEDGSHTEDSLGTEERERTQVATSTVTVALNGKTATAECGVWQEANAVETYEDLGWLEWSGERDSTFSGNAHQIIMHSYSVEASAWAVYTSGKRGYVEVPLSCSSLEEVEACDWARLSGSLLIMYANGTGELRGPYDVLWTCSYGGLEVTRLQHFYQTPDRESEETYLTVTPSSQLVLASAGSGTLSVDSSSEWSAETTAGWLALDETSGDAGETAVGYTVAANRLTASRTATVTFTNDDGLTAEFTAEQAGTSGGADPDPEPEEDTIEASAESVESGETFLLALTGSTEELGASVTAYSSMVLGEYVRLTIGGGTYGLTQDVTLIPVKNDTSYACVLETNISSARVLFEHGDANVTVRVTNSSASPVSDTDAEGSETDKDE